MHDRTWKVTQLLCVNDTLNESFFDEDRHDALHASAAEAAAKVLASNWSDAIHDSYMEGDSYNKEMLPSLLDDVDEVVKLLQAWKKALQESIPTPEECEENDA